MDDVEYADIDVQVLGMTDAAVLMRDDDIGPGKWVPRSLIERDGDLEARWREHRQKRLDPRQPYDTVASIAAWKAVELGWL